MVLEYFEAQLHQYGTSPVRCNADVMRQRMHPWTRDRHKLPRHLMQSEFHYHWADHLCIPLQIYDRPDTYSYPCLEGAIEGV
jgi:hypothetical protein